MKFFLESSKKYNKILDGILKDKEFNTEVNNLLLIILNHLNDMYSDYKKVKVNVLDKDIIINTFLNNVKENVNNIEVIKENIFDIKKDDLGKTGIRPVEKQKKEIVERKVNEQKKSIIVQLSPLELYTAIVEVQPKYFYIKDEYVFKEVFQNILEEGAILNAVELLRDFKGYSWYPKYSKKFPYIKNVMYQNLIWLLGVDFMYQWENQNINLPDYIQEMKISLIKQFGDKYANDIIDAFYGCIYSYSTEKNKDRIEKELAKKQEVLETMEDLSQFLTTINKQKKILNERITSIDLMLNNDKLLVEGFKEKNDRLSPNKKIASIIIFKTLIEKERTKASNEYEFLTMIQKPKNFIEYKEELTRQIRAFDRNKKIYDYVVELELAVLNTIQYKMELENTSSKILLNLKSLRYFKFLKVDEKIHIKDIKKLNKKIKAIEKILVTKLCELGTIQMLSYDIDINYDLISVILETQTLDLEDLLIELDYKPLVVGIRIYDKDTLEKELAIKTSRKPDLAIKLRKKTKLFP